MYRKADAHPIVNKSAHAVKCCRPMRRQSMQTVKHSGTPWRKPSAERKRSLRQTCFLSEIPYLHRMPCFQKVYLMQALFHVQCFL